MSHDHDRAAESYDTLAHHGYGWRDEDTERDDDGPELDLGDLDAREETDENARRND